MSRDVATKETVRNARRVLLDSGKTPTQRSVQAITGGSMTTVGALMRELDQEEMALGGPGGKIQEKLGALVMELHRELQQQAEETVAKGNAAAQLKIVTAEANLEAVQQDYEKLRDQLVEAERQISKLTAAHAEAVTKLNEAQLEMAIQASTLLAANKASALQDRRMEALEHQAATAERALTAYQGVTADARRRDQESFNNALDRLGTELAQAKAQLSTANSERAETTALNLVLNRDAERLSAEVRQLSNETHELKADLRNAESQLELSRGAETTQKLATAAAEGQISLLNSQLEECTIARTAAGTKIRELDIQNLALKNEVQGLVAQNDALKKGANGDKQA